MAGPAIAKVDKAPSMFSLKEGCTQVLTSGNYTAYLPKDFRQKERNQVDGKTRLLVKIEEAGCFLMDTSSGKKWVVQETGAEMRFMANNVGSIALIPYALNSCGNKIYDVVYLSELQKPTAPKADAPVVPGVILSAKAQVVKCEKPLLRVQMDDGSIECTALAPVTAKVAEPKPVVQNPCQYGGTHGGVTQDGDHVFNCNNPPVAQSSSSWVPWAIGAVVTGLVLNNRWKHQHGGYPGVVTQPPSILPGVRTGP